MRGLSETAEELVDAGACRGAAKVTLEKNDWLPTCLPSI